MLDICRHSAPQDQGYFRQSREERFGRTLEEVVKHVIPLTYWYHDLEAVAEGELSEDPELPKPRTPDLDDLWEDIIHPSSRKYKDPKLLPVIRMAGIIAYIGEHQKDRGKIEKQIEALSESNDRNSGALRALSKLMY